YASSLLNPDADDDAVARVAALVEEAGGRAWTVAECGRRLETAAEVLSTADIEPQAGQALLAIANYVTARDR
ncbi:MAG TPA: polyprenyl synthetase family protein, partial [Acidothermaceae bacterium]